jgi:hypothetical protein
LFFTEFNPTFWLWFKFRINLFQPILICIVKDSPFPLGVKTITFVEEFQKNNIKTNIFFSKVDWWYLSTYFQIVNKHIEPSIMLISFLRMVGYWRCWWLMKSKRVHWEVFLSIWRHNKLIFQRGNWIFPLFVMINLGKCFFFINYHWISIKKFLFIKVEFLNYFYIFDEKKPKVYWYENVNERSA